MLSEDSRKIPPPGSGQHFACGAIGRSSSHPFWNIAFTPHQPAATRKPALRGSVARTCRTLFYSSFLTPSLIGGALCQSSSLQVRCSLTSSVYTKSSTTAASARTQHHVPDSAAALRTAVHRQSGAFRARSSHRATETSMSVQLMTSRDATTLPMLTFVPW